MSDKIRIVLAQLNLKVGDIAGNLQKHIDAANKARDTLSADIIVFPELSLTGYSPEDLLLRRAFIDEARDALKKLKSEIKNIYCLVGHPFADHHHLFNACTLFHDGKVLARYAKQKLPNYGIFDEGRYFTPGISSVIVPIRGLSTGIVICEDLWRLGPTHDAASQGAQIILSPNASPFEADKHEQRLSVISKRAQHDNLAIVYVNHVGGQDDVVFDGGSMVVDAQGKLCQHAGFFNETLLPVDVALTPALNIPAVNMNIPARLERIYQALVLSVRDYLHKNNMSGALVGVSGGIDSALTLAIAVDALGKENVRAVMMPSRYTADISLQDAKALAENLGVKYDIISIEPAYQAFQQSLGLSQEKPGLTEENIQARCRAVLLMALSNQSGKLVLTTGNRSEMAVGYCTLYGDMAGGFAPLKDVPKTLVYELAAYRNQIHPVIPLRTIERPPTAELAPDQKDENTLPPYSILDQILEAYLNQGLTVDEMVEKGFQRDLVVKIIGMIRHAEYKRKQSAPGTHINHKSFGRDWRYPMTDGFKG
jgi:NAD+ synthase (glutamine-hydrolysing)